MKEKVEIEPELTHVISNPFRSVGDMLMQLNLPNSKYGQGYRLVDAAIGQIKGLPQSQGKLVASDGIKCVILQEGNRIYLGHHAWFESDAPEEAFGFRVKGGKRQRKESIIWQGF